VPKPRKVRPQVERIARQNRAAKVNTVKVVTVVAADVAAKVAVAVTVESAGRVTHKASTAARAGSRTPKAVVVIVAKATASAVDVAAAVADVSAVKVAVTAAIAARTRKASKAAARSEALVNRPKPSR
jgi:hypothetical protein